MIFQFGWTDWEDYAEFLVEHTNKTEKEFWLDCKKALSLALEEALKFKDPEDHISLEETYREAQNILLQRFGYTEPKIVFGPRGNMCLQELKDRDSRWALGTRLLEKLQEHNNRAERLYEDRWK